VGLSGDRRRGPCQQGPPGKGPCVGEWSCRSGYLIPVPKSLELAKCTCIPVCSVDVDNMSKPILDRMQTVVYKNDRQIRQAEISHVKIGTAFQITGVSKILVNAIQAGTQFLYVRIEDPVDPFPLPK